MPSNADTTWKMLTLVASLFFFGLLVIVHADDLPPPPPPPGPVVNPVSIASDNASTTLAKTGNVITLSFTSDGASLITPTATIAGHDATVLSAGGNSWTASMTMTSGDTEGLVLFSAEVGNADGSATTTVSAVTSDSDVVFDKTAPVITLSGASSLTLTVGDPFTDSGATASDAVTANLTVSTGGSVNTSSAGTYTLTYNAVDAAGNNAVEVTRTVTVNAAPAPVPSSGGGGGGGSGGSLYAVAPVLGAVPLPAPPSSPPATNAESAPTPSSNGPVLGAQTTNNAPRTTASIAPPSDTNTDTNVTSPLQVAGAAAADAEGREKIEWGPQVASVSYGVGELPPFLWWFLLFILALVAGYWTWRKYREYKKNKDASMFSSL